MRPAGIYKDVPNEEYHSEEGISNSSMGTLLECPARYKYEKDIGVTDEKRKRFLTGQVVHTLILEPELFDEMFIVGKRLDRRSNAGKEAKLSGRSNMLAEDGRTIVTPEEYKEFKQMALEGSANSIWTKIKIGDGNIESSIYWDVDLEEKNNFALYPTRLRSRPDFFNNKIILEIKTTDSIKDFQRTVDKYGYYRQAAMQTDALRTIDNKERKFFFLAIETRPPYLTKPFDIQDEYIELGRQEYKKAALIYAKCLKNNEWPGYDELDSSIETVCKPKYRILEEDN